MQSNLRQWGVGLVAIASVGFLMGADEPKASEKRDENLAAMRKRAELLRAEFADDPDADPLTLVADPIFRYGDPTRIDLDGTLWLWTQKKRPIAILCLFMGREPAAKWTYELTSLAERPLKVMGRPQWTWRPRKQQRRWLELKEDVPKQSVARGRRLRSLARQFKATEILDGDTRRLRLLPRPLYRYSVESTGVVDGALFVMATGTNPEVLLQFEARRDDSDELHWVVSFARLSSAKSTVQYSGKTVWTAESIHYSEYDPDEPYYAAFGADPLSK